MTADDAKDELEVSKRTLALVIETAIHALTRDAIERVMIAIFQEDQYRSQLRFAADQGGGDITDAAVGQAINRTLVRQGIHESFFPVFTTEVLKSIFRDRARGGRRYGRDDFRRDFAALARALESESLDVAEDGELCRPGAGGQAPVDTAWVDNFDRNVLDAAREILTEIKRKLDMDLEAASVTISAHWRKQFGALPDYDDQERDRRRRMELLRTLQQRGVVELYGEEPRRGDERGGITVEASRSAVDATINAITDLFEGRRGVRTAARAPQPPVPGAIVPPRSSLPPIQQAALPPEIVPAPLVVRSPGPQDSPPAAKPLEEFGRAYTKGFAGKFGEHSATGVWVLIGLITLLILGAVGWRKQITALYESVVHPTAEPDTSTKK